VTQDEAILSAESEQVRMAFEELRKPTSKHISLSRPTHLPESPGLASLRLHMIYEIEDVTDLTVVRRPIPLERCAKGQAAFRALYQLVVDLEFGCWQDVTELLKVGRLQILCLSIRDKELLHPKLSKCVERHCSNTSD
jgi:hypothetical protein